MKDTDQVIRNLSKIEQSIVNEIVSGAQAVQAKTINDARSLCPAGVTGALANSIQAGSITVTNSNVTAVVEANMDYASYLEFGTGPAVGHAPYFPPMDALKDWAAKKLGDEKLAFAVARAIYRHGTKPHPFMGPALLQNLPVFRTAIIAAIQRGIQGAAA